MKRKIKFKRSNMSNNLNGANTIAQLYDREEAELIAKQNSCPHIANYYSPYKRCYICEACGFLKSEKDKVIKF